jgi:hypothetical protein
MREPLVSTLRITRRGLACDVFWPRRRLTINRIKGNGLNNDILSPGASIIVLLLDTLSKLWIILQK